MKYAAIAIFLAASVAAASASRAAIYRWVAKDGTVTYQDQPPPPGASQDGTRILDLMPAAAGKSPRPDTRRPVVLYAVPRCDSCDLVRAYLKRHNVPFREVNVSTNSKAQLQMRKAVGDLSVPAVTIGSKVIQGYMPSQLSGALIHAGFLAAKKASGSASPAN
ncbi:MAG: glutaredoxin family protein [Gammaproteobacteria bacterium]|nr:glutaredoxin family protein [Gammaproteobacteria bacterium]